MKSSRQAALVRSSRKEDPEPRPSTCRSPPLSDGLAKHPSRDGEPGAGLTTAPSLISTEPCKCFFRRWGNACLPLTCRAFGSTEGSPSYACSRWHKNSVFRPGPRQPQGRDAVARFLFLVKQHRRPRGLSSGHQKVAEALVRLLGADGRLDPSHATLAALATVSVATVQRALDRLRQLGLLFWQRRLVRDEATGWRCEQTSNAYVLTPAACDMQPARPVQISLIVTA